MKTTKVILILALLATCSIAFGGVPKVMNLSGYLTDSSDNPLDGSHTFLVRIYDAATLGTELWQETHVVDVDNGKYNLPLGSISALNLTFDNEYWVSIEVNSDGEMSPRIPLTSVPYAKVTVRESL